MRKWKSPLLVFAVLATAIIICFGLIIRRGFRATAEPSYVEKLVARKVRNLAIPSHARHEQNPLKASAENLQHGRELFLSHCANCHGVDATGLTPMGSKLYPRAPNFRSSDTQNLTDGEIHYIIQNGVQLTGMPAWGSLNLQADDLWQLVIFVRNMRPLSATEQETQQATITSAHYVGSQS